MEHLEHLLSFPELDMPAINQVELHPLCAQHRTRAYCAEKGIVVQAYSSMGQGAADLLDNSEVMLISEKHSIQPSQVLLLWALQQGIPVIPKSTNPERMRSNLLVDPPASETVLDDGDMETLNALDRDHHFCWNPEKVL